MSFIVETVEKGRENMTAFNDREKAAENKYAHDQELEFRIEARRNKLLGLWAAQRMNLSGLSADEYAKTLVAATVNIPGDQGLVDKVKKDLSARGVTISDLDIKAELHAVTQIARDQVKKETK